VKYTGNTDPRPGPLAGTERFVEILTKGKADMTNLGIWANRPMRSGNGLSVHATGRAFDVGYKAERREWAAAFFDWLVKNYVELGIEEIHDYSHGEWGRGFRCSRPELGGKPGVKIYTKDGNAGTPGGKWLHLELAPEFAKDPARIENAWKATIAADRPPFPGEMAAAPPAQEAAAATPSKPKRRGVKS
jgi:hypothetical protein